jgi:hypothetical protein
VPVRVGGRANLHLVSELALLTSNDHEMENVS